MSSPQEDHVLLDNIKLDDATALDQLFRKYYAGACAIVFYLLKDKELSEEIGADVFVRFWEKRKSILVVGNLKGYLFKMAKNMAIDQMQRNRIPVVSLDNAANFSAASTPEDHINFQETQLHLVRSIHELEDHTRIIFTLSRDYQLKYREIAALLQVAEKTVERHMTKALRLLRNHLDIS